MKYITGQGYMLSDARTGERTITTHFSDGSVEIVKVPGILSEKYMTEDLKNIEKGTEQPLALRILAAVLGQLIGLAIVYFIVRGFL